MMGNICQLIVDPPADGAWNMAVDEALLGSVAEMGVPTLRFYQWESPTLSLGYFQNSQDRQTHAASKQVDMVRRLSGGGAIVHDRELTYSLMLPAGHVLAADTQTLYQTVHQAIIRTLGKLLTANSLPWQLVLCEKKSVIKNQEYEPFLCFQRRANGDVLLESTDERATAESRKIVGSAQRRRQGAVLQHGSLLLNYSEAAPELLGFCDIAGIDISAEAVSAELQLSLSTALEVVFQQSSLSNQVCDLAEEIRLKRYGNSEWLERR